MYCCSFGTKGQRKPHFCISLGLERDQIQWAGISAMSWLHPNSGLVQVIVWYFSLQTLFDPWFDFLSPQECDLFYPFKGTLHIKLACKDPTILVGEGRIRKRIIKLNRMADNNWQLRRFQTTCKLKFIFCFIGSRL